MAWHGPNPGLPAGGRRLALCQPPGSAARLTRRPRPAAGGAAPEVVVGGALYTWGGDLSWVEPGELRGGGAGKRDHHRGCLGHGDLEGRLLPTPVAGELQVRRWWEWARG
jgi:hypothetical protein